MTEATTQTTAAKALPTGKNLTAAIEKLVNARRAAEATIAGIDEKLPALRAAEAAESANAEARKAIDETGLPPDTQVVFIFGRKDTRKPRDGRVVAFAPAGGELPARYRVSSGVGFEEELCTVPARDVFLPGSI